MLLLFSGATVFQVVGMLAAMALIAVTGFRLDSVLVPRRKQQGLPLPIARFSNGYDEHGEPFFVEPDGRTLRPAHHAKQAS
jgi:hypothetical protein